MSAAADTDGSGFKSQEAYKIKETLCPPVWRNGARLSPPFWHGKGTLTRHFASEA